MKKTTNVAQTPQVQNLGDIGRNVVAYMEGTKLHIVMDTTVTGRLSKSRDNMTIATTGAPQVIQGTNLKLGVNLWRPT